MEDINSEVKLSLKRKYWLYLFCLKWKVSTGLKCRNVSWESIQWLR